MTILFGGTRTCKPKMVKVQIPINGRVVFQILGGFCSLSLSWLRPCRLALICSILEEKIKEKSLSHIFLIMSPK